MRFGTPLAAVMGGMTRHRKIGPKMLGALAVVLAGCSARPQLRAEARPAARAPFNQGASWEVVLSRGEVASVMGGAPAQVFPEYGRNDRALSVRTYRLGTASDEWPESHPELWRRRYIDLPRQPGRFIYFLHGGAPLLQPW